MPVASVRISVGMLSSPVTRNPNGASFLKSEQSAAEIQTKLYCI